MSKTIRVNVTQELLAKLEDGQTLTFTIPACACGIDRIEVGVAQKKGIFDGVFGNVDEMFKGLDGLFTDIFGNKRSSR